MPYLNHMVAILEEGHSVRDVSNRKLFDNGFVLYLHLLPRQAPILLVRI